MGQGLAGRDTDFGRVRRALLRQGEGDRVPFFELSIDKSVKSQFLGRALASPQDEVDFWRAAGYDFVSIRAGVRSVVRGLHPAVKEWLARRDRRGQDGSASRSWVSSDGAILRTRSELADFPWPKPEILGGYNDYARLDEYLAAMAACLPPDMKLIVQLGYIFMGAWQLIGFENFCIQLTDDPGFVDEIVTRLATSQLGVLEILLQHASPGAGSGAGSGGIVGAVFLPDDLCYNSGPVVSPRVYQRLIYPWYRQICDRCHAAGLPVGLHSDGDLTQLLPDLVKCGFDCLHPLEPPFNDILAIKRDWGGRIALAGNVDLKSTLSEGTPEDVEREVKEKCALLAPGGGWLVGSSNSIPDFVPLENYRALLSAGLRYGRYGIREDERPRATSGRLAPGGGK